MAIAEYYGDAHSRSYSCTPAEVANILDTRPESLYQRPPNWRVPLMAGLTEGQHSGRPNTLDEDSSITWNN